MIDEKQLLQDLAMGDKSAYSSLYLKYSPLVREFAYRLTQNMEDAEDVAHNIFLILWEKRDDVAGINSFKNYLFRITNNAVFDLFKKRHYKSEYTKSVSYFQNEEIDSLIYANDLEVLIALAIETMPKGRKEVFMMSRYENMSYQEIADKLNISPGTVKYHISNALIDLRKIILSISIFVNIVGFKF